MFNIIDNLSIIKLCVIKMVIYILLLNNIEGRGYYIVGGKGCER